MPTEKNSTTTLCIRCKNEPIKCLQRRLGGKCYHQVYLAGQLHEYPKIFNLPRRTDWASKYGELFLADMEKLRQNIAVTLQEIGNKHGLSRERIRQIFKLIYGHDYSNDFRIKTVIRTEAKERRRILKYDPRYKVKTYSKGSRLYKGALTEELIFNKCVSLNYEVKLSPTWNIDLIINDYQVEAKSAHIAAITSPKQITPLYHFTLRASQDNVDFIICHAVPINKIFIIPRNIFPKSRHLYIPEKSEHSWRAHRNFIRHSKSKYYQYLDAWHLLAR